MISAFFSASETAFLSLSKAQVRRLQNGSGRERIVHRLLKDSQRMLGTVLLGNLFVNTLLTVLTATLMSRLVASTLVSSVLSIAVVAPILILGGELIPKIRGLRHNLSVALFAAPILLFLSYPLAPILWVLNGISIAVLKLLGFYSEGASWEALTNGELLATFDSAESTGAATSREHDLLERILRFGTIQAREIMLPRMQIVGIEDTTTLDEAFRIARKSDFSALPVFHENLDDVWCVLSFDRILKFRNTPLGARPLSSFRKVNINNKVPITLKHKCIKAALLAFLFVPILDNKDVVQLPILSPYKIGNAPCNGIRPCEANAISIPIDALELCKQVVIKNPAINANIG